MKAVCWNGVHNVKVENVPEPRILSPRDAIVRITSTAICGSDLHLYDGFVPSMQPGDIIGHEFMGEVVEVGPAIQNLRVGDRVVVPFTLSCGRCFYCEKGLWALCDNTNPNAWMVEALYGYSAAGMFGYSHLFGGYAGGQAEYARVPYADTGPLKIPDGISDEQVLFLSDILPTAYMAAENGAIQNGDTVAVWGGGPVGQLAAKCAYLLGAAKVILLDRVPERLKMAREIVGAEAIDYSDIDVVEVLKDVTGGRGPDVCIDAVGLEAHGASLDSIADQVKHSVGLETDLGHVLREAIQACRKGGTVSVPGVYAGFIDKFPIGAAFGKGLQIRLGQTHVQKYMRPLLEQIQTGAIDPTFIITHRIPLEDAAKAYQIFRYKQDGCIKVILKP